MEDAVTDIQLLIHFRLFFFSSLICRLVGGQGIVLTAPISMQVSSSILCSVSLGARGFFQRQFPPPRVSRPSSSVTREEEWL